MEKNLAGRYYTCFFTGHRIIGTAEKVKKLREKLYSEIENLVVEYGVETFICGGALGFDMISALEVLRLKEKYPWIFLKIYVPCYNHDLRWNIKYRELWRKIAEKADKVVYITPDIYNSECMKKRNLAMVKDAHYCLAYCTKNQSGTGMTLRFAQQNSCCIRNLAEYM